MKSPGIKHKLFSAVYFGTVAHFTLPFMALLIQGQFHLFGNLEEFLRYLAYLPIDPISWSGGIWGYLFGHKICGVYTSQRHGFLKSLGIGVAIPALSAITLGSFTTVYSIFVGQASLPVVPLMPLGLFLLISFFSMGLIYLVGLCAAALLYTTCKISRKFRGAFQEAPAQPI